MKTISTVVFAAVVWAASALFGTGLPLAVAADDGSKAQSAPTPAAVVQPAADANADSADEGEDEAEPGIDGWDKVKLDPKQPMGKVDADAAITLARNNGCFRCHAITRVKPGPSFEAVAQGYKGNLAAGYKREYAHLTAGDIFVFAGIIGHHRVLETDPPNDPAQLKNLVDWILSLDTNK
jgi:cytochrome c